MAAPFPATPSSTSYATVAPSTRCGIYYGPSPTPSFTLSKSGSATYVVLNWQGVQVSSGSVSGTTVAPAAPAGGWLYGWYRLYLYDGSSQSSGACNFCVIRSNSSFITNPASGTSGGGGEVGGDEVTRGVFVIGPQRYGIAPTLSPSGSSTPAYATQGLNVDVVYYTGGYTDSNRPRPLLISFSGQAYDALPLINTGGVSPSCTVYCLNTSLNGSLLTITVAAGSVSGNKVTVAYNGSTVETYDNVAAGGLVTATASSAYIAVFPESGGLLEDISATAIGNSYATAVASLVSEFYPTVTYFEGPSNEPNFSNTTNVLEVAHQMLLFHAAVKNGASGALVMGPAVDMGVGLGCYQLAKTGGPWDVYLGALVAAGTPCDAISFHAYNMLIGDLNMMRTNLAELTALFAQHGLEGLPVWQTEQGVFTPIYSVYHPRRARWSMLQILVQESYGIPKEQNNLWYDGSHGFWSQPTWWENINTGLNPQAVLVNTFSQEVFGCNFHSNISFGTYGDKMYFGGYWQNPSTGAGVAIFMSPCPILGSAQSVTLTVTGTTSPLTLVDAWGNSSTVPIYSGRVVIPVTDTPSYLQLPNGVSVNAYSMGTWLPLGLNDIAPGQTAPQGVANGVWENGYDGNPTSGAGGAGPISDLYWAAPPETATQIEFARSQTFNRVVIWCGMVWQKAGTLTDFDVQTSPDGATWTTQGTVTALPPTTLSFTTGSDDVGCTLETYWQEPWIFDVPFAAPVTAQYVRLNTRSASYGGEPDAGCVTAGGQGYASEVYAIEEIGVFNNNINLFPFSLTSQT